MPGEVYGVLIIISSIAESLPMLSKSLLQLLMAVLLVMNLEEFLFATTCQVYCVLVCCLRGIDEIYLYRKYVDSTVSR